MLNQQIGAFEAKTHFSQILARVENGSDFIVTKRGKPVAKIIPIQEEVQMTYEEALEEFKRLRKNYKGVPGDFNIKEAIEWGRK